MNRQVIQCKFFNAINFISWLRLQEVQIFEMEITVIDPQGFGLWDIHQVEQKKYY